MPREFSIRRALLRPLFPHPAALPERSLAAALERLDRRVVGEQIRGEFREVFKEVGRQGSMGPRNDPGSAWKWVALSQALLESRAISAQQYAFYVVSAVLGLHEARWMDGGYEEELGPVARAIAEVRTRYGLAEDEHWGRGKGPKEYRTLNDRYEAILDGKRDAILREFGLHDLADLLAADPDRFEELVERGRRSVFHSHEQAFAIQDTVLRYEDEADRAADAGAYAAAIIILGAAMEGLLVLRCLRSPHKAARLAKARRRPPQVVTDPTTWQLDILLDVCLRGGWLPPVETQIALYDPVALAQRLKRMRNHVHPGKLARERPWLATDESEYQDAKAIYVLLMHRLKPVIRF